VDELVSAVLNVAGKQIRVAHIEGPVGVLSRNFSNQRIYSTGWRHRFSLHDGIARTYPWVEAQVQTCRAEPDPRVHAGV
jgi:nucleoside-diphosphate-sugar epimerase